VLVIFFSEPSSVKICFFSWGQQHTVFLLCETKIHFFHENNTLTTEIQQLALSNWLSYWPIIFNQDMNIPNFNSRSFLACTLRVMTVLWAVVWIFECLYNLHTLFIQYHMEGYFYGIFPKVFFFILISILSY
jgi:hypothetical protein